MTDLDNAPEGVEDAALFESITTAAPQAETPEPEAEVAETVVAETPVVSQPEAQREDHRVPLAELKAERERRQSYERDLANERARFAALEQQVVAMQRMQTPVQPPDIFENPDAFVQARVQSSEARQYQVMMYNAKLVAEARFTEQAVTEAQEAFDALVTQGRIHPAEAQQVMSSPNPFAEAVKWHQRHKVVSEVGTDPNAYREKLLEQALNDPDFRKRADALWRSQAGVPAASPQTRAQVINLPSLSRVGSAALTSLNDEMPDDNALFHSTVSRKRR